MNPPNIYHDNKALMDRRRAKTKASIQARQDSDTEKTTMVAQHMIQVMNIALLADRDRPDTMRDCFYKYVDLCMQNGMKISNMGAYTAMGINPSIAKSWRAGNARNGNPAYKELIVEVNNVCATIREQLIVENAMNPIVGIWQQKNYDGMSDNPVQMIEHEDPLGTISTAEEIEEKYKDLIED